MVFGTGNFYCTKCGNTFKSLYAEYGASVFVQPMKCPKCGSWHTLPGSGPEHHFKSVYESIWKHIDAKGQDETVKDDPIIQDILKSHEEDKTEEEQIKLRRKKQSILQRILDIFK